MAEVPPPGETTIYTPVPIDAVNEVRLLSLHAGSLNDDIECSLLAGKRSEIVDQYEALSYTWGAAQHGRTVTVNDNDGVPVTDNLFAALRRLRNQKTARTLWVDSICIDQNNSIERSVQVQHIRQVYSNAYRVIVWLGDSDAMAAIPLDRLEGELIALTDEWRKKSLRQAVYETNPRWWERVWVWQEFAAAKMPPLICFGRVHMEWDEFKHLAMSIHMDESGQNERSLGLRRWRSPSGRVHARSSINHIESLADCLSHLESLRIAGGFTNRPFSEMIRKTVNAKATDPRDKIFSLVGFLTSHDAEILKPDYTKTEAAVCAAGTYAYSLETDLTTALSWAQLTTDPTWAIDFEYPPELGEREVWLHRFNCSHSQSKHADGAPIAKPTYDWETLSIKINGSQFDKIEHVIDYPIQGLSQICDEVWFGMENEETDSGFEKNVLVAETGKQVQVDQMDERKTKKFRRAVEIIAYVNRRTPARRVRTAQTVITIRYRKGEKEEEEGGKKDDATMNDAKNTGGKKDEKGQNTDGPKRDPADETGLNDNFKHLVHLLFSTTARSPYRTNKHERDQDIQDRIRSFKCVPNENHHFSAQPRPETESYNKQTQLRGSVEERWEEEIKSWSPGVFEDPDFRARWEKFHRKSDISKLFTLWSRFVGFQELEHATNYRIFHEAWQYYAQAVVKQPAPAKQQATIKQPAIFTTSRGFVGIATNSILRGDIVGILSDVSVPVILRLIGDHYTFQGFAHVHGIMYGELMDICPKTKFPSTSFQVF